MSRKGKKREKREKMSGTFWEERLEGETVWGVGIV